MMLPTAVVAGFIAVVVIGGAAAQGAASKQHSGVEHVAAIPIDASATTPTRSTLLIAMGHLDDPSNTFWEVFLRSGDSTEWKLQTPPGVASNGGLVLAAPSSGRLTVGFLVSADLKFSPVAQTSDGGDSWSAGALPFPLVAAPNAIAVGSTGEELALVSKAGQSILATSGNLSRWRTLTSTHSLAHNASTCDLQAVTAVAFNAQSQPVLGLDCAHSGEIGILAPLHSSSAQQSGWRNIGPSISDSEGSPSVIRLENTVNGLEGLAQIRAKDGLSLMAFWGQGSTDQWSQSTPLTVPSGWTVKATATGGGAGQGMAVLLGSGNRRQVEYVAGPATHWATLPNSPPGTSGVAWIGKEIDTFVASGSRLGVWASTPPQASWHLAVSITVPVPYGSSS